MMIQNYISNYLNKAKYELIDGGKNFYAEIKELRGVWATGKTLEECRENLVNTLEGWIILRLRKNLPVPNLKIPTGRVSLKKYA
jgi:predicted RNase H-like HicB family nuclease